ncbi:syntaxin-12-like isoform 1-T1 [Salvelinus alpinus]
MFPLYLPPNPQQSPPNSLHPTPNSLHPAPNSLHPAPNSLHPTVSTLPPTVSTLPPTVSTLPPTVSTLPPNTSTQQPPPNSLHPTASTQQPPPNSLHPTASTQQPPPNSLHPTPNSLHPTPNSLHPTPNSLHPAEEHTAQAAMSSGKAGRYLTQPRDSNTLIQTCSSNIQKITQNTAQIKSMVNQLGTGQDTSELRDSLQQIQHFTNLLAKETNKHLKDLGSVSPFSAPSEQRQQKIQKDRLMNDFSAALNNFQAIQRQAAQKEKESVARARAGSRLSAEDGASEEQLVSFDNQDDWGQTTTQTTEEAITEEDLVLIKERETNIRQLESDILDVNQIFKDLAVMIHDQGEVIDSIEANVESAEVHVDRGTEQLQRAAYFQQKSRKKMCILAVVLSIVLTVLGIIIWQATQ